MSDPTPIVDAHSKPPRRFRRTRIAVSVFFGVVTVALWVLWVRSYWRMDFVEWSSANSNFGLYSNFGDAMLSSSSFFSVPFSFYGGSLPVRPYVLAMPPVHRLLGITWSRNERGWYFGVSHCLAGILSMSLAITPWIRWSNRFSLRTLLIATTLVAVVLGLGVWLAS